MIVLARHARLRLLAALRAWLGLLAVPTRVLAECPMLSGDAGAPAHHAGAATPSASGQETHAGHEGHEGHEGIGTGAHESGEAPAPEQGSGAPEHTDCPDLAHCAVVALTSARTQVQPAPSAVAAAQSFTPDAPLAPARVIEPPPPKH